MRRPLFTAPVSRVARKPCSAATTCAPSPIAPPTRLTDPERTSPTANTPGTDVSSADGGRLSPLPHCAPVTTKPPRSTMTPQPSSQSVAGSAPTNRNRLRISTAVSSPPRRLRQRTRCQRSFLAAVEPDDLGIEQQFDVRRGLDPLDQIARHAGAEAAAADHHVDLAGMARQEHRGLPGGIAAADQRHLLLGAEPRLDRRGPVPDAAALEAGEVFDIRPAVARAARHHDGARAHQLAAVGRKRQRAIAARAIQRS